MTEPTMTKQHFELIAKTLNSCFHMSGKYSLSKEQAAIVTANFALSLEMTNKNFDRDKFWNACLEGVPTNE